MEAGERLAEVVEDTIVADTVVGATNVVDTLLEVATVADTEVAAEEATLHTSDIRLLLTWSRISPRCATLLEVSRCNVGIWRRVYDDGIGRKLR